MKDLFIRKSPYVKVISDIIGEQIKDNEKYSYLFPDAYKGIQPDQPFLSVMKDLISTLLLMILLHMQQDSRPLPFQLIS